MTLETLCEALSARTGRTVRPLPAVVSEEVLREEAVFLSTKVFFNWPPARASLVTGPFDLLAAEAEDVVRSIGPGRAIDVHEWHADRARALWGRPGAARVPPAGERPRALAENPHRPSPGVLEAMRRALETGLNGYPEARPRELEERLARRHGCSPDEVVVAAGGSQEVLARCLRALPPGLTALAPTYDQLAPLCVREGRPFVLQRGTLDPTLPAAVYVASPNNPDSRIADPAEIQRIRAAMPPDRVLILDRAWAGFESDEELFAPRPEGAVVQVQTFSKLFGMAGLRLGYALAPAPIAELLRRHTPEYEVPMVLEWAARAALADAGHRAFVREQVRLAREDIVETLEKKGWHVPRTTTHQLLAWPPEGTFEAVLARIERRKLPIEECPQIDGALQFAVPKVEHVKDLVRPLFED